MDPSVITQAQRGLEASWATPLRFWNARAHRTEKAEQALDALELLPEARPAVELARAGAEQAPARKLELYRLALETLSQQATTAAAGPMAGLALKLLDETHLQGAPREEAAGALFAKTPTSHAVRTLLADLPAPQKLQLVHECASREEMALRLPDPAPLSLAEQDPRFQALPPDAPRHELARSFLEHPDHWMASWLSTHRDQVELARWTIAQAPESDWKQHDDPLAVALHIHQGYQVENLVKAALDSDHPERWLATLQKESLHRPQEAALELVGHLPPEKLRPGLELIDRGANAAALASKFPELRGIVPRTGFLKLIQDRSPAVLERCLKATGEQSDNLAAVAFRTAGATNDLDEKFSLAQLGLIELDRVAANKPATRLLWGMTRLHQKTPHPEAAWLRTALALEGLAVASRGRLPETPRGLVELGIKLLDSGFMVPSWYAPAASTVIETLQECAGSPLEVELLEAQKRKLLGRVEPEQARKVLVELGKMLGSTPYQLAQGARPGGVAEKAEAIIVGGVKVTRRGQSGKVEAEPSSSGPSQEWPELKPDSLKTGRQSSVEPRYAESGSLQGVYNPNRGQVEWRTSQRQLAGAYNPRKGEVEWQESDAPLAALYNPEKGRVVFQPGQASIQGLYNPVTRRERFEEVFTGRRAGAYRPLDGQEHWETCTSGYNSGVYDPQQEDFHFLTSYSSAVAAVSNDPSAATLASNGAGPVPRPPKGDWDAPGWWKTTASS